MTTTPCLHTLPPGSSKVCSLCRRVVPGAAREAARLRGRHSAAAKTTIPNHGPAQLRLVRGDDVRTVEVTTRPREESDGDVRGMLVAEVTKGCTFSDGAVVAVGTVYPVSAAVTPIGPAQTRIVVPAIAAAAATGLNSNGNYIVEVAK